MILGPIESYSLLMHMGKLPALGFRKERMGAHGQPALFPLPTPVEMQQQVLLSRPSCTSDTMLSLANLGLSNSTHVAVVGDAALRRKSEYMRCIVFDGGLPSKSVLHVSEDIYMLNPALCLLLLSRLPSLSDVDLVFAAFQLCARYGYAPSPSHELVERVPHTSRNHIENQLDSIARASKSNGKRMPKGMKRLRGILPYVHDGARSPREISIDIMMSLPTRYGGIHTPPFETNKSVSLTPQEQHELGKRYLESDFVWEQQKVILEYNGGVHEEQREPDSARTNVLRDKGYTVEVLTSRVFDNFASYMKFMARMEKALDFRIPQSGNALIRQRALHAQVLGLANRSGRLI